MVFFNYSTMQMAAKVVYYGPGLCGKTTNLQWIFDHTSTDSRGEMVSLATETDRTLFFDLLPIDVGTIAGFNTRIQLYTVPGQVFYNTTRKLVLKGVDGVVFVADSQQPMLQANIDSLNNLEENLNEMGLTLDEIPVVLQYNKRDLPNILSVEELDEALKRQPDWQSIEASAVNGDGVLETLKMVSKATLLALKKRLTKGREPSSSRTPSPGARPAPPKPAAVPPPDGPPKPAAPPAPKLPTPAPPPAATEPASSDTDTTSVRSLPKKPAPAPPPGRDTGSMPRPAVAPPPPKPAPPPEAEDSSTLDLQSAEPPTLDPPALDALADDPSPSLASTPEEVSAPEASAPEEISADEGEPVFELEPEEDAPDLELDSSIEVFSDEEIEDDPQESAPAFEPPPEPPALEMADVSTEPMHQDEATPGVVPQDEATASGEIRAEDEASSVGEKEETATAPAPPTSEGQEPLPAVEPAAAQQLDAAPEPAPAEEPAASEPAPPEAPQAPAPPAKKAKRKARVGGLDALAELEKLRHQALRPSKKTSSGTRELSRKLLVDLPTGSFTEARRVTLALRIEDAEQAVLGTPKVLEIELGEIEDLDTAQKVTLQLKVTLRTGDSG